MRTEASRHSQNPHQNKKTSLKESIAEALNAVNRHDVSSSKLKGQEPPETRMVYAMAYHYLNDKHSNLADEMLKNILKMRNRIRDKGEKAPIFKATDNYIQRLVKEHKISKDEGEKIMRYAVGKANLIGENGELSTKRVSLDKGSHNMDAIIEKIMKNKSATAEELAKARESVAGKVDEKPITNEPFTPGQAPSDESLPDEPGDLSFRPNGSTEFGLNGVTTLRLPSFYDGQIDGVAIFDSNGEPIGELIHKGKVGKNSIWSFDNPEKLNGKPITLKLHHLNGGVVTIEIPDGGKFHRESYA